MEIGENGMRIVTAFFMAWGNFLTLPCPYKKWDGKLKNLMMAFVPAVGAVIGLIWTGLMILLRYVDAQIGMPDSVAALISTFYIFAICGFMHLDGYMDCNDAILSRRPQEEKQRILKDSNVGAFAVVMLGFLLMAWYASMVVIWDRLPLSLFFVLPVLSRAVASNDVLDCRPMKHSQYAENYADAEERTRSRIIVAVCLLVALSVTALAGSFYGHGMTYGIAIFVALAGSLIGGAYARQQLGGMSGDVAGYEICWCEAIGVIALAVSI